MKIAVEENNGFDFNLEHEEFVEKVKTDMTLYMSLYIPPRKPI
jgi:hypothetical protein